MEDRIKDTVVLVLIGLTVICFIWAINSSIKASNHKKSHQEEAARRMDLEQSLSKLLREKSSLETQINAVEKTLESIKQENAELKKELNQEQLVTKTLKEELEKLNKLKITLEENLKEALVRCP